MEEPRVYLVLGCFGRRDDTFVSCRAVENRILKISENLVHFDEIMTYFESVRLIDKPMFDTNAIRHVLYNMQDRYDQNIKPLWHQNKFRLFEKFLLDHKACGLYLKLIVSASDEEHILSEEPQRIKISATPKLDKIVESNPPLKLVRTRR